MGCDFHAAYREIVVAGEMGGELIIGRGADDEGGVVAGLVGGK